MSKINLIFVSLLLMGSCYKYDLTNKPKSRSTREVQEEQTEDIQEKPEAVLRSKLNDTEKSSLDFLKQALGNDAKFNKFVLLNESKVKSALKHIQTELEKCTEDKKNAFKAHIQGYFDTMDENRLDSFKTSVISTCN
ncbi:Mlp family lipoprotein (plasmid) [Borrelia coriaceae]|uniref:Mlp lipoprotein family protein n=1 Tax=Borrelia coriaceae ATCC 43381 TaxID=1408429 RepID=W5SYR5_9SPIR|nr:Mlp family lipoprotein [Borrelia coriaceae]AHH11967.1 Mlp lipoprotein family protein [Borrelia coriaceae ATCC 43381]UPA16726.1 Mlp family lipoprotein [Borrelia coriaceae]